LASQAARAIFHWPGSARSRVLRECEIHHLGDAAARAGLPERAAPLGRDLALGQGEPDWRPPVPG